MNKIFLKKNILIFNALFFALFISLFFINQAKAACPDPLTDPGCQALCVDSLNTYSYWGEVTCSCKGSIACTCDGNYTTSCSSGSGCVRNTNCGTSGYTGTYRCLGTTLQAEYIARGCSSNACTAVTSWVDWTECSSSDGCYAYSTGCEDREYYCSSGAGGDGCLYTYARSTDYYDAYQYYCSGSDRWRERKSHDFYCASSACTDHTSWVDQELSDVCGTNYCSGTIPHSRGCSGGTCYDNAGTDCGSSYWGTAYCSGSISSQYYYSLGCSGGSCYNTPILYQTQCPTPDCTAWAVSGCSGTYIQESRTCYTPTCSGDGVCGSTPYVETRNTTNCTYCCSSGSCTGVCSAGATGSQSCGSCGTQTRTCSSSCAWGSWSTCIGVCAPSSLTVAVASASQINLTWTDNANNETGFKIERADNSDCSGTPTFSQVATVGAGVTTYSNTGLTSNVFYCYRVRAYDSNTNSAYSNTASSALIAPSGLTATAASAFQVNLGWTDNSSNETSFRLERKIGSAGTYTQIASLTTNTKVYVDVGVADGTTYYYRVKACHAMACSSYSSEVSVSTILTAPTSLTCTAITSSQINLNWVDNSTGETGFEIKRDVSSPPNVVVFTTGQNATSSSDTNLLENTTYYYRLRAYNANSGIYSGYSNTCSAVTPIYVPTGNITSSIFDMGSSSGAAFNSILWKGTQPSGSNILFQFASSNSANPSNFIGPDGTSATYYQASGPNIVMNLSTRYHNNHRYFRYKIYIYPNTSNESPQVTDVVIGYSP